MKKIELLILGPFDRFNYGDLLFPKMLEHAFQRLFPKRFTFNCFSLVGGTYRKVGGVDSANYRSLRNSLRMRRSPRAIVVAGGESLAASWHTLYSMIHPVYRGLAETRGIRRLLYKAQLARLINGGKSEYPFNIDRNDFGHDVKILYNSVGGTDLSEPEQFSRLEDADYVAVREKLTADLLRKNGVDDHYVVPDSAIILSDVLSEPADLIRSSLRELAKERYVFFQIANYPAENDLASAVEQLVALRKAFKARILLCPIGTALLHEDQIPLAKISSQVDGSILVESPSVEEIAYLIAKSSMYIGSSLHGLITALSYGVPHVSLGTFQSKIRGYLDTWVAPEHRRLTDLDDFFTDALAAADMDLQELAQRTARQKELYYSSVKTMAAKVLDD